MKKQNLRFDNIIDKLIKNPLKSDKFFELLALVNDDFSGDNQLDFEVIVSSGLPLSHTNGYIKLDTIDRDYKDQEFVFVDIETNGSDAKKDNIIEIGALKVRDNIIIDRCESLVYDTDILPYVSKVTGITDSMIENAPQQKDIAKDLRNF
jgi:DNA polymerase-3 subunit epsilon